MKYKYWFANVTGIGNVTKKRLYEHFKGARQIYEADHRQLIASGALKLDTAGYLIQQRENWETDREFEAFKKKGISLVTMEDGDYPVLLNNIYNAPYALYYLGRLPERGEKLIAMVGARRASGYGRSIAHRLAMALTKEGFGVVSGMAMGIDSASHEGALEGGGRTYAFLGSGVDVIYPRCNCGLYERIIDNGAVISDYVPGTKPLAEHFPARNRLISGIAKKTLVIEAKRRSGSLITAEMAMEQGRDVLALPGRITDPLSEGTNHLISMGAGIITGIDELLRDLKELEGLDMLTGNNDLSENISLEKEEALVYSCFDFYAKGLEEVQQECGIKFPALLGVVMSLCAKGLLGEVFKNQYIRLG